MRLELLKAHSTSRLFEDTPTSAVKSIDVLGGAQN